jgi:hypothetical protein
MAIVNFIQPFEDFDRDACDGNEDFCRFDSTGKKDEVPQTREIQSLGIFGE